MRYYKIQYTIIILSAVFFFISGNFIYGSEKESVVDDPDVKAAIEVFDAWIQHRVYQYEIPGVSVGLVYDQQLIWAKGYGYADLEKKIPTTPTTAYRIASLTKLFTATAVLQLRDAEKLQLDDPVSKHLDWFYLNDPHGDSPVITIRHLLTHSSGLAREFETLYWDDLEFPDQDAFIEMFQESSTILPRESKFKYSNVAFNVLGFVVESASGESYADYVTDHILSPLGMTSTEVTPSPDMAPLATGYHIRVPDQSRAVATFFDKKAAVASGNMASSVEDLAKFISLQFTDGPTEGHQILKGSTIREMHRPHWLYDDWKAGRGLGWGVARQGDQVRIRHGGSVPGYTSSISAVPAEKFGVVVLTNADDGAPGEIAAQAWAIVAPLVKKAAEEKEESHKADPSWTKFEGAYQWDDGSMLHVMLLNNELALVDQASDAPWEDRVRLEYVSENTFKMLDQWQEGESIYFEENESGKVTRIIMPGYSLLKIK
jgi:D-alanyl-D-alanine carboxypeptidase